MKNKVYYDGLEKVKQLAQHIEIDDCFSDDYETKKKLNEVIRAVNLIIDILNDRLNR